ncbi:hypothetical protein D3C71_1564970 [compost metagenome]
MAEHPRVDFREARLVLAAVLDPLPVQLGDRNRVFDVDIAIRPLGAASGVLGDLHELLRAVDRAGAKPQLWKRVAGLPAEQVVAVSERHGEGCPVGGEQRSDGCFRGGHPVPGESLVPCGDELVAFRCDVEHARTPVVLRETTSPVGFNGALPY